MFYLLIIFAIFSVHIDAHNLYITMRLIDLGLASLRRIYYSLYNSWKSVASLHAARRARASAIQADLSAKSREGANAREWIIEEARFPNEI